VNNKKTWGAVGMIVLVSALLVGFFSLNPSAEDVLVQTIETLETITDAHAVVEFNLDTVENKASGTVEVWGRKAEDGPGMFRLEVLEASDIALVNAVVVSDGETIWAYDSAENKVLTGTFDEVMEMVEQNDALAERKSEMPNFENGDFEYPENAEEGIQLLMEYFDVDNTGTDTINAEPTYLLKFVPIADQMPAEFVAVGGYINLWIDKDRFVPLAAAYAGGTFGEVSVSVKSLELNTGLGDALFTFETPPGAEVMGFAAIMPQSVSLEEADASAEFHILAPMEIPEGATLVDALDVQGAIVLRYTLPEGGSFTIAQGVSEEALPQLPEAESVNVRGAPAKLYIDEDGSRVLLTWVEAGIAYSIAGDLTTEQAVSIAESLQ